MELLPQPDSSRLLEGLKKRAEKKLPEVRPAINFTAFYEEKEND